jgi:hypothetical protein
MEQRNDCILIFPHIFRALGLAMCVAAVVLNLQNTVSLEVQVTLLGFGIVSQAIAVLDKEERDER